MKKTAREAARQRKITMILIIVLIIALTVLGGGYYLLMQTKENAAKSQKSSSQMQTTVQTSQQDSGTVEYNGEAYKYNDHLSNYLFLGIGRYLSDTAGCRSGRCDIPGVHGQSNRTVKSSVRPTRYYGGDRDIQSIR